MPGSDPTGPSQTNRVSLPARSSTPASNTWQPYTSAAIRLPSAAQRSPCSATSRTASAVELVVITRAPGSRVRMKRVHCAFAWGWETTTSISSSSSSSRAIRHWRIAWTVSPTIATSSVSIASASSVALTEPSIEFSIGTTARSTVPSRTAMTVS